MSELDLSFNEAITHAGTVFLSDMIKVNKSLEILFLEETSVGEEGAAVLMEGLLQNQTITELWRLPVELAEYCKNHSMYDEVQNVLRFYH